MRNLCTFIIAATVFVKGDENFEIVNKCNNPIWVGALGKPLPFNGGFKLDAQKSRRVNIDPSTKHARIWARTGCSDKNGRLICDTGDCGSGVECKGATGQPPATLAEFTLKGDGGKDFYDISNVDGYNVGVKMEPINGQKVGDPNLADKYNCGAPQCTMDVNRCPAELKITDGNGRVSCASICGAVNNANQRGKFPVLQNIFNDVDQHQKVCCACDCGPGCGCENPNSKYCCSPVNNSPNEKGGKCRVEQWPKASNCQSYDRVFKDACGDAYSWQFDDHKATYFCKSSGYKITFCP